MQARFIVVDGVRVPRFLYGTAWKEDATRRLTELALEQGFRGIDTANQRRHYHEAAVGQAIAAAVAGGLVARAGLFLQTKFTFRRGQDHRLPYDPDAPVATQVEQSVASSLRHLGTEIIDSYLLHGPAQRDGLAAADWEAWRAMEAAHDGGRVRLLGVSNFSLEQLRRLCGGARVRPRFVQNRCYANQGWDRDVRAFCAANGLVYQGFSLLTANRDVLNHPELVAIARHRGRTVAQVEQSFAGSLAHLGTDRIDSYLLHGPSQRAGLGAADWQAWRAMEALHDSGRARLLGVSNFTLEQLQRLCQQARVPPRFVQNRCYASRGWDRAIREFCGARRMVYQGFSLLTANREALAHPELARVAGRHGRTVSQIVFRFALEVGMVALTGTAEAGHMREDLDVFEFRLAPDEVERIDRLAVM